MSNKHTTDLIAALAAENKPTRRMWPVGLTAFFILVSGIIYCVGCASALYGLRDNIVQILQTLFIQIDMITAFAFATTTLMLTLRSAIPGQEYLAKSAVKIGAIGIGLLFSINVYFGQWDSITSAIFLTSAHCFLDVALFSALPVAMTFYAIKRAAPTDLKNTGRAAVLATMFIGYAATRISCEVDSAAHGILTHITPLVIFGLMGALIGKRLLRW